MKKFILIFFMFCSSYNFGQELMNFFLSPDAISGTTEGTVLMLHTTFYAHTGAELNDYSYTIEGNVVNFKLCYALSSTAVDTFDKRVFEIILPTETGDYIFNFEFYTDYINGNCLYETISESGSIDVSLPYLPTEKVEIEDAAFESYLENLNYGDDEYANGWVYKHRIDNVKSINFINEEFNFEGEIESLTSLFHFKNLKRIKIGNQPISNLNFEENPDLELVYCEANLLENINVSNNPKLIFLWCTSNDLSQLDVTNNLLLETLKISSNLIDELDLSNNMELIDVSLLIPSLNNLDVTNTINLEKLSVTGTQISTLDLSNNQQLFQLTLNDNELLTELDISTLTNLNQLYCSNNNIEFLDLSLNQNLTTVKLLFNNLNYLNIKNGNNEGIITVETLFNPNLVCIEIDDEDNPQPFDYLIDDQTEFSEDCTIPLPTPQLGISTKSLLEIKLYPNPVNNILLIETQPPIEIIKMYNLQGKLIFQVSDKDEVDVSNLNSGLYFIQLYKEGNMITKKFIKL